MVKHRRYSRKRVQRRNRRASRKMKGGIGQDNSEFLNENGFTEQQIEYLTNQYPDMDIAFIQLSLAGNNPPFFPEAQTPDQIIAALQAIDVDIDNADESLNTTREAISQYSNNSLNNSGFSNISSIPGGEDVEVEEVDEFDEPEFVFSDNENVDNEDSYNSGNTSGESSGGKRRTNKKRTNKRKTKKTKKTRKHRRRRYYGGRGFTTEEETTPLAYIDSREISEANMPRP